MSQWCVYIVSNRAWWTRARRVALIQKMNPNWTDLSASLTDLLMLR